MTGPDDLLADAFDVALEVGRVFDDLGVPWYIGGSVASSFHGLPRSTLDVDVVAGLPLTSAEPFVVAIADRYYVDLDAVRDAIRHRRMFNAIHLGSAYKVDVYPVRADELARAEMKERVRHTLSDGRVLPIARPEHLVIEKLLWYRAGGHVSDRQWTDVLGVLSVQQALDAAAMRHWAEEVGVADLLERALNEAAARG